VQEGTNFMQQLLASVESSLELAKHAEVWGWKEVETADVADKVDDRVEDMEVDEMRPAPCRTLEVVEAPGDLCGNKRKLPDGSKCPGCMACQ
jgi:hypothetical protein